MMQPCLSLPHRAAGDLPRRAARILLRRAAGVAGLAAVLSGCGADRASGSSAAVAVVTGAAPASGTAQAAAAQATDPVVLPATVAAVIVQAGDSIGAGVGADWAAIDHLGFPAGVIIRNVSVSGKAMQTGYGYRTTELFPYRSQTAPSVLLIQQGTNDLYYGKGGAALYRDLSTPFVAEAKKAGFYVVLDTVLPRTDSGWTPAMERERIAYNALVRGNRAGADAVNDLAADPVIGDGNSLANGPYYADGAHPSLAGQQRLVTLNAAVLAPFLVRPLRALSR